MDRINKTIALLCSFFLYAALLPAVDDQLTITCTTSETPYPTYADSNVVSVWLETDAGVWVKNFGYYAYERNSRMVVWAATSGYKPSGTTSTVDGYTGATRNSHGPISFTMDVSSYPAGAYKIQLELSDNEHMQASRNNRATLTVDIGGAPQNLSPSNTGGYSNISIQYTGRNSSTPPTIASVSASSLPTQVMVVFDAPVQTGTGTNGAENIANYDIPGLIISAITLDATERIAYLTLSTAMTDLTSYNLSVSYINSQDWTPAVMPTTVVVPFTYHLSPTQLQFESATTTVAETAGTVAINVIRTGGLSGEARVDYATSPSLSNSATPADDYQSVAGTLIFSNGVSSQTINVAIYNDILYESDEFFKITLTNTVNATLGTPAVFTVTIDSEDSQFPNDYQKSDKACEMASTHSKRIFGIMLGLTTILCAVLIIRRRSLVYQKAVIFMIIGSLVSAGACMNVAYYQKDKLNDPIMNSSDSFEGTGSFQTKWHNSREGSSGGEGKSGGGGCGCY